MHEWRFGWNFVTGEYIAVPKGNGGRDYADYPADQWVMASCDAAWIEDDRLYIEDLKTGAPQGPMCEQIVFIARCAQQAFKHEGPVVIQILNATRYGYKTAPKSAGQVRLESIILTEFELDGMFKSMIKGPVMEAVQLADEGIVQQMDAADDGKHCFFCRSKAYCYKYRRKASPKSLMYLDKLREAQEARQDGGKEQGDGNQGSGQSDNGPDTGGHDGGGAG
jgi:ribosomal protein L24E